LFVKPVVYDTEEAILQASVTGTAVAPPITWTWDFGDGTVGQFGTSATGTRYGLPYHRYQIPTNKKMKTYTAVVTAEDDEGHQATDYRVIYVIREPFSITLRGPRDLWPDVLGERSYLYTATAKGGEPPYLYTWSLSPDHDNHIEETSEASHQTYNFHELGVYKLVVVARDVTGKIAQAGFPITVTGGEELSTSIMGLPATAEVDEPVTVSVQAQGGVLVASGKKRAYGGTINWGVGNDEETLAFEGATATVTHPYSEPGKRTVSVKVWDAAGGDDEDSGEITIEEKVNTAPVADSDTVMTDQDTPVTIYLMGSDADGDTLTYDVESQPSHGSLSDTAPDLTYTPDSGFSGSDSFTFKVNDGQIDSSVATVSITVSEVVNASPVAEAITTSTTQETAVPVTLRAEAITTSTTQETAVPVTLRGTDADGDDLTYDLVSQPSHGSLSGTGPFLSYTPESGYDGTDSFTYRVNDGRVDSAVATVNITIEPEEETIYWVLTGVEPNPLDEQTEFYGGGVTPYWFGEPRFEGKAVIFTVTDTSLCVDDRSVDHGHVYHDVSICADIGTAPAELEPGEPFTQTVHFAHDAEVTSDKPGIRFEVRGSVFRWNETYQEYGQGQNLAIEPGNGKVTPYFPWSEYEQVDSAENTFVAPQGEEGDKFEIYSFLWNAAPCTIVWTFQAYN